MRASTLNNNTASAIYREIGSKYDLVKFVAEHMAAIEEVASDDIDALIASLNEAKDFTGITVISGSSPSWDAVNKILTVPTVKGDKGDKGDKGEQGDSIVGPQGIRGPQGPKGNTGANGAKGMDGMHGINGQTPIVDLMYDANTGMMTLQVVGYTEPTQTATMEW